MIPLLIVLFMYFVIIDDLIGKVNWIELLSNNIEIEVQECGCLRKISLTEAEFGNNVDYDNTTCSKSSFARGSGQKVVTFSFYHHENEAHSDMFFKGNQKLIHLTT